MTINLNTSDISKAKDLPGLQKALTNLLNDLENQLKAQPNFLILANDSQDVPKNTPVNSIIFKFDETLNVITGYYDGENLYIV